MTGFAPIWPPTAENIQAAARALAEGRLVAFPTETVYGLGGDATNEHAVAAIFEAKGRPRFNPLIIHFADRDAARREVRFDDRAEALADVFWPGPLTLVLPRTADSRIALLAIRLEFLFDDWLWLIDPIGRRIVETSTAMVVNWQIPMLL